MFNLAEDLSPEQLARKEDGAQSSKIWGTHRTPAFLSFSQSERKLAEFGPALDDSEIHIIEMQTYATTVS